MSANNEKKPAGTVATAIVGIIILGGAGFTLYLSLEAHNQSVERDRENVGGGSVTHYVPSRPRPISRSSITLQMYGQISTGMTYDQVVGILKMKGTEISRSEVMNITTAMYMWQNGNGANMNVIF